MQNAEEPLSDEGKVIIGAIVEQTVINEMKLYGKSKECQTAFRGRLRKLKRWFKELILP